MRTKIKIGICGVVVVGFLLFGEKLAAQLPEESNFSAEGIPVFYYDIITLKADKPGKTLLRIFTKIAYDELQFVREKDQFQAGYELSTIVFDKQGGQVGGKISDSEITVEDYKKTNSRKDFSLGSAEFILLPGDYKVLIEIMDKDSKKRGRQEIEISVPDYSKGPINVSGLLLADQVHIDSLGNFVPVPNVLGNFGETQKSLYLWFEIYNHIDLDSVKIVCKIVNVKDKVLLQKKYYKAVKGEKTVEAIKIPGGELEGGRYNLLLTVGEGKSVVKRSRKISVHWMGMPAYAYNLDNAIEQLKYIAKGKELKKMKKCPPSEKEKFFREFWRSKDPTPGTEENELMEEYYRRVDYANANFGTYIAGWKTDRGMVYILLGAPNDVERHPFEPGSRPYEIWYYNRFNRRLIFVDYSGFGEYRLVTPLWDIIR